MVRKTRNKEHYMPRIDGELDLHGCRSEEARYELATFLAEARANGWSRVRVIVGKGIHSEYGQAVLPHVVKGYLMREGLRYTYAKLQEGGEGALVVCL